MFRVLCTSLVRCEKLKTLDLVCHLGFSSVSRRSLTSRCRHVKRASIHCAVLNAPSSCVLCCAHVNLFGPSTCLAILWTIRLRWRWRMNCEIHCCWFVSAENLTSFVAHSRCITQHALPNAQSLYSRQYFTFLPTSVALRALVLLHLCGVSSPVGFRTTQPRFLRRRKLLKQCWICQCVQSSHCQRKHRARCCSISCNSNCKSRCSNDIRAQ